MALRLISRSPRRRILFVTVIGGLNGLVEPGWARKTSATWHQQRMPGPHGFAVRFGVGRLRAVDRSRGSSRPATALARPTPSRPPRPAPTFVTMANAPLAGRDGQSYKVICISEKQKYFLQRGWTGHANQRFDRRFCLVGRRKQHGEHDGTLFTAAEVGVRPDIAMLPGLCLAAVLGR
jgi:hypothetical protein